MCVVVAELRVLLLHAAAELCCVLYDVPHYEKIYPEKLYCLAGEVPMYLFWGGKYFMLVVFWHRVIDRCFFL